MKRASNISVMLLLLAAARVALASEFSGATLEQAIETLEARGLSILYSSDLVKSDMRVVQPPQATDARSMLQEIVQPHGISVADGPGGTLILTRAREVTPARAAHHGALVSAVVVTASRYEWVRIPQASLTRMSEAELRLAPNVGDDPLRTLARLPGTAASDYSAKLNIRGGVTDEVLIRFDGLRLMNPFHLEDFQSIFSAINPSLVGAVDVYTGAFPVSYGDRMSGVIDIHPVRATAALQGEIAVSLYNASAVTAGRFDEGRGDWLASARRGNLDRVLEWSGMKLGEPAYSDVYAHIGHALGNSLYVSANVMRFDDDIELADSDAEEQARARYRDRYAWLRFDAQPRASLTGSSIVSRADLESVRSGVADQPGISRGALRDRRDFSIETIQTDWSWRAAPAALFQFGGEMRRSRGHYAYEDHAEFDLLFDVPGAEAALGRGYRIEDRPDGEHYSAYVSVRAEAMPWLTLEGGLRWDRSTLTENDRHVSPRASALFRVGESALLRASWGRFVQTQSIDELPVSDGVTAFSRAQRAEHWLAAYEQRLNGVDLRIEGYRKRYSNLRPRFENLLNDVVILPELKPDRIRLAPSSARAYGIELSLRSLRARRLFWWASYAWSQAEDVLSDGVARRAWDQRHALNAGIGWDSGSWELSLAGTWHSGWPTVPLGLTIEDEQAIVRADSDSELRMDTYFDVDVRVARKFQLGDRSELTAFLEISNVTNRRNECCTEYGLEDESAVPVLEIESIRSLPLLPSLGVLWRF